MSMYRFVKGSGFKGGSRLFVQATREGNDRDDVADGSDVVCDDEEEMDLQAVYTQRRLSTEVRGSSQETTKTARRGSTKSVTTRIVKKTTTLTRGEQRTVTESVVRSSSGVPETRTVTERVVRGSPWGWEDREAATQTPPPAQRAVATATDAYNQHENAYFVSKRQKVCSKS